MIEHLNNMKLWPPQWHDVIYGFAQAFDDIGQSLHEISHELALIREQYKKDK